MSTPESFPIDNPYGGTSHQPGLTPELTDQISLLVADAHEHKTYRPVSVAVIQNTVGRLLLVQSVKNLDDWGFPQGGVEAGEDAAQAVIREAQEETGIHPDQLTVVDYFGSQDLDAEAGRVDKRGFTKGKRYLFFHLLYSGQDALTLQESELAGYAWTPPAAAPNQMATTRPEKRAMLTSILPLL